MKKSIALTLTALLLLSITGCGSTVENPADRHLTGKEMRSGTAKTPMSQVEEKNTEASKKLIPDEGLRTRILSQLHLTEEDDEAVLLRKFTECEALILDAGTQGDPFFSLESLSLFPNLKKLEIYINFWNETEIENFTPLAGLTSLESLYISYDHEQIPADYGFVADLPCLEELFLPNCHIEDISFLEKLPRLKRLSLYGNPIKDLAPLGALGDLTELALYGCETAAHIEVIGGLTKLEDLGLQYCGIENVDFLKELTRLKRLNLNGNRISDLTPLAGLVGIERLGLADNQITDITPLSDLTKLWDLSLDYNRITDITVLESMTGLNQLGLSGNQISDLEPLVQKADLLYLNVRENPVRSLSPVWEVPMLLFGFYSGENPLSKQQAALLEDQVRELYPEMEDYHCLDSIAGDLDGNGLTDLAFVIDEMLPGEDKSEYYSNERYLIVLLQNSDKTFRAITNTPSLMGISSGGMRGDPYGGILLENGFLTLCESWGSSSGSSVTSRYVYQNDTLLLSETKEIGDYAYHPGNYYQTNDAASEHLSFYALAYEGYRMRKLFLYSDSIPWHTAYPTMDLFSISYLIPEAPVLTEISASCALDLCLAEVSPETGRQELPYAPEQKQSLELLYGIRLPDYYYEVSENDYLCYNRLTQDNGRMVHEMKHVTPDTTEFYYVYDDTGEIAKKE